MKDSVTKIQANLQAFGQRLWAATRRMKGKMREAVQSGMAKVRVFVRR